MNKVSFLLLAVVHIVLRSTSASANQRLIIGILAQEEDFQSLLPYIKANSYIAASYVKAVESSGARVAPILIGKSKAYYRSILNSINGVIIPGGSAKLESGNGYYDASTYIYEIALELNQKGIYFPILGICLGFEAILTIANNHKNPLVRCDITHENYPLFLTPYASKSLQYSNIDKEILHDLKHLSILHNNHVWCVTPEDFAKWGLSKDWRITSTSTSSYGLRFISSAEHEKYPFVILQFHPEKAMFEWKKRLNVVHSEVAIKANRYFYDFFIHLASRNYNQYVSEKNEKLDLIYNYQPITPEPDSEFSLSFEQIYVF